jgi:hypothetical protein
MAKKKEKKHFLGVGDEKIHTAREGTCRKGSCNYRDNAGTKPRDQPQQAHHVIPVSATIAYKALKDAFQSADVEFIDAVYKNTDWCVNQGHNMRWLPIKGAYTKRTNNKVKNNVVGTKVLPRGDADVWSLNAPCHDWDHNCGDGYTDEAQKTLKAKIWDSLRTARLRKLCPEKQDITANFDKAEDSLKRKLSARGRREGGTKAAIAKEGKGTWWLPFSMAKTGTARGRVVRSFGRGAERAKGTRRKGK